jgi:hypothetical protein
VQKRKRRASKQENTRAYIYKKEYLIYTCICTCICIYIIYICTHTHTQHTHTHIYIAKTKKRRNKTGNGQRILEEGSYTRGGLIDEWSRGAHNTIPHIYKRRAHI